MTERKPAGVTWESWIDRQIREGRSAGAFDDLRGAGQPLENIGATHDEMWWVKAKLRAEDIEYLPPTIAIRAERDAAIAAAMTAASEEHALVFIDDINQQIRYVNSHAMAGPPSSVMMIDVEAFVERWRAAHPDSAVEEVTPPPLGERSEHRSSWLRRLGALSRRHRS